MSNMKVKTETINVGLNWVDVTYVNEEILSVSLNGRNLPLINYKSNEAQKERDLNTHTTLKKMISEFKEPFEGCELADHDKAYLSALDDILTELDKLFKV